MICATCQRDCLTGLQCDCGQYHCPSCFETHVCVVQAPPLWPHQEQAIGEIKEVVQGGQEAACVTSPPGGGKTRIMAEIISWALSRSLRTVIYTHRKLLTAQTSAVLQSHGIDHGIMAADYQPALLRDVQIASVQTVNSRCLEQERWEVHPADIVILDEAHANRAATVQKILKQHQEMGAVILGFTATPTGVGHLFSRLIVAGTNSELRACGALVPCRTYAPTEPDLTTLHRQPNGEYVEEQVVKTVLAIDGETKLPRIFGDVLEHWLRLNPEQKPTLLFAPGVAPSRWFSEWLTSRSVPAAHIDGTTPDVERRRILAGSEEGSIKIVCNRFVLREGIDMPWLAHLILATAFGAVTTYIQAGGRALRAYPGLEQVVIQDHGGNWWQPGFGSLNDDRQWSLEDTNNSIHRRAKEALEYKEGDPEGACCPRCGAVNRPSRRLFENGCPICGHKYKQSVRHVIQADGTLQPVRGIATKHRKKVSDEERAASNVFYTALHSKKGLSIDAMDAIHYRQSGKPFPDGVVRFGNTLIRLPSRNDVDWKRSVRSVFSQGA